MPGRALATILWKPYITPMIPVRFKRPPVIEVVCGIQFATPDVILKTAHVGLLWEMFSDEFPMVEDVPPLGQPIEQLGPAGAEVQVSSVQLMHVPPLRRSWFVTTDGAHLIQIQEDRILFNWKRAADDANYPSYDVVIAKFESVLEKFSKFVNDAKIGKIIYRQFELSYVNHIDPEHGLGTFNTGNIFADHQARTSEHFLPTPDGIDWKTSYALPEAAGRLHVGIRTASRATDRAPVVRMDLTARGLPKELDDKARREWFDMAHTWITHGFADLTSSDIHAVWERIS